MTPGSQHIAGINVARHLRGVDTEHAALLDVTIGDLFDQRVSETPEREAVVYSYPELDLDLRLSYRAFQARVNQLAKGLMALGIEAGEKIAVLAPNLPEWLTLEFALALAQDTD